MSSPLALILGRMQEAVSRKTEGSGFISEGQKWRLLHGVFGAYYGEANAEVVFDTNRGWTEKLPLAASLFPEAKLICCVRNVAWIMDSIERLLRANPTELSGIFGFDTGGTVFSRVNSLAAGNGLVGYAMDALRGAYAGEQADRLIILEYEALVRQPQQCLDVIYDFLSEPRFEHDPINVEYEAEDFDLAVGTPGLHRVKGPVAFRPRRTILPPQLFDRFAGDAFWRDQGMNTRSVPVIAFDPVKSTEQAA